MLKQIKVVVSPRIAQKMILDLTPYTLSPLSKPWITASMTSYKLVKALVGRNNWGVNLVVSKQGASKFDDVQGS